ncbi:MAG: pyridoxal-phosphate dependent enzyme, partial [Woeseia sp.]|nr:pyridoxal-phosphate dependent enzyme [Woeseia sp.]
MNRERLPADIVLAANRINPHIRETPLDESPYFSELTGANVYMKLENLQHTGSFKLRGAFNKVLSLTPEQRLPGCVTASSGNHGAAIAFAMKKLGVTGVIFVPEQTSSVKVDAIKRAGGDVRFFGTDGLDTETHAREYAEENDMVFLSPYNDADVIAGQGTVSVELVKQLSQIDAVFVAVGGGGLISGVGSFIKSVNPAVEVVSCQPAASAVMTESVKAGKILDLPSDPTLSDGTAGGIEA